MILVPRPFRALVAVASVWGANALPAEPQLRPMRDGTELFVDDVGIARRENLVRRVHPAAKLPAPVLVADQPWEQGGAVRIYGTVLHDAAKGEFRMWYSRQYATSRDGVHWTKPRLDVVQFKRQPTNFVLPKGGGAVIFDEIEPDPAKRYKALANEAISVGGFSGYYSADGIHWTPYPGERVLKVGSELGHVMRDPATRKYFAYVRPYPPKLFPKDVKQKRLGAVVTSDDFEHWSEMKVVLEPDAIDDAWVKTPEQRTEFYAMNGFAYGRSYLGIIPVFRIERIHETKEPNQSKYDGPMHGELITSRNGLDWHRPAERAPVIPSGTDFDRSIMNVAISPVIVGDEVWEYYTAINSTHGAPIPPKRITIGLAKWRLDGFMSLDGDAAGGIVETTVIGDRTGKLEVNADASKGQVVVEVLGENGQPLPGYSAAEAKPVVGNSVRHAVEWNGRTALPAAGSYRLRFRVTQASLYSYTIR